MCVSLRLLRSLIAYNSLLFARDSMCVQRNGHVPTCRYSNTFGTLLAHRMSISWKSSVLSEFKSEIWDQCRSVEIERITCVHVNLDKVIV